MARQATNSAQRAIRVGPFSHAVQAGELMFLCGQVGQDPATGKLIGGGVRQQTQQIFANMRILLKDLGLTPDDVLKVNVFLRPLEQNWRRC